MTFDRLAQIAARGSGRGSVFMLGVAIVLAWAATGPFFGFNDTWQLVINTATTIVTFLMVFLIQNSQVRDTDALHVKLDELIRVTEGARLALLNLEELPAEQLERIRESFMALGRQHAGGGAMAPEAER